MTELDKNRLKYGRWDNYNLFPNELIENKFWWIKFNHPLDIIKFFHISRN